MTWYAGMGIAFLCAGATIGLVILISVAAGTDDLIWDWAYNFFINPKTRFK